MARDRTAFGDPIVSDHNFHSDPVMRLTAQRAARAAAQEQQEAEAPKRARSVTMVIYAWAAAGLVAFGVATTSLIGQSDEQPNAQVAAIPDIPDMPQDQFTRKAGIDEDIDLITTSSINVKPTVPAIVNIYPRSYERHQNDSSPGTYGAQIGGATDIDGLVATFVTLEKRAPDLMQNINPLIRFDDKGAQIASNLIAGPFTTRQASAAFCEAVTTKALLICSPAAYQGDPLLGD